MIETRFALPVRSPIAVDRALDLARTGLDRGERVRHAALGVVVAVDADAHAVSSAATDGARRRGDLRWQR